MIKLFIDTATSRLIVGIYKDNKELYLENVEAHNDLSSRVLPTIKKICEEVNIKINDVDEIYVVNGPGSFTGIRVGVTIAKTLAWSLNKKIYTVSELQLQASCGKSKYIVPMIDARRGYVYAGVYNKNLKSIIKDQYIELDELKNLLSDYDENEITFVSYDKIDNTILPEVDIEKLLAKGKFKEVNPHNVNPNYLKKTEAEEKLNDKNNN
jgi:tRNA threonylcarbamoyl adenosine modification protein YeaZ